MISVFPRRCRQPVTLEELSMPTYDAPVALASGLLATSSEATNYCVCSSDIGLAGLVHRARPFYQDAGDIALGSGILALLNMHIAAISVSRMWSLTFSTPRHFFPLLAFRSH